MSEAGFHFEMSRGMGPTPVKAFQAGGGGERGVIYYFALERGGMCYKPQNYAFLLGGGGACLEIVAFRGVGGTVLLSFYQSVVIQLSYTINISTSKN